MQFAKLNNTHVVEAHVRSYRATGLSLRWEALQSPAPTESYFIPQKRVPTPFTLCSTFLRGPTEREEDRGRSQSGPRVVLTSYWYREAERAGGWSHRKGEARNGGKLARVIGALDSFACSRRLILRISREEGYFDLCDDQRSWRQEQRP